jgi:hypothetical protein
MTCKLGTVAWKNLDTYAIGKRGPFMDCQFIHPRCLIKAEVPGFFRADTNKNIAGCGFNKRPGVRAQANKHVSMHAWLGGTPGILLQIRTKITRYPMPCQRSSFADIDTKMPGVSIGLFLCMNKNILGKNSLYTAAQLTR